MNQIVNWLERFVLPWANKLGQVRWLVALRDAFVSITPITIAGSIAVLIRSLISVSKVHWHWNTVSMILSPAMKISNIVWQGTFSIFAIYFALAWGYQLAEAYEVHPLAGSLVSLSCFVLSIANVVTFRQASKRIIIKNAFDTSQLSTTGLFAALVFGGLGVAVYIICIRLRWYIRMSASMTRAARVAFEALVPGTIAIFLVAAVNYLFQTFTGSYFGDFLLTVIQIPLTRVGQGFGMVLLVTFLVQIFWFFGMSGTGVLSPIIDSVWVTAQNANVTAALRDKRMPFIWARGSFNVFVWLGGCGSTLMLLIAILWFSKRSDSRTLAKVALAPSLFNIDEPVIYGLPIAFNPVYFIPFVLVPFFNVSFSYWVTQVGLVNPVQAAVPSILPPVLSAYLACNYDWRAIVVSCICLAVDFFIWLPFVFAANRIAEPEEKRRFFNVEY